MCRTWVTLVGWLVLTPSVHSADLKAVGVEPNPAEIAKLIEQLGDRDYTTREAAAKRLSNIGEPALAPLASVNSDHPERAEREVRLLGSIRARIENERAIAPTLVELPKGEQSLRQVFEAIEVQSRVKLWISDDSVMLARRVKLDGGKKPLWEQLNQVMAATGLDVAEVNEYRGGSVRQTEEDKSDAIAAMTPMRQSDAQKLKDHMQELTDQIANSTDPTEKAELKNDLARVTRYYEKLTGVDQRLEERKKSRQSLIGRVTFKASETVHPSCVSGAVRIEAVPVPVNLLKRYPTDQLPLMLKAQAEPRLAWQGVSELLVVEAIDERGRSLAPTFFTPGTYTNLANDELQFRRANMGLSPDQPYQLVPHDMGIAAVAARVPGQPVKLKSIRGMVKASLVNESSAIESNSRFRTNNPFLPSPPTTQRPTKEVTIPFQLTDVTLVPGTGDGQPLPEEYEPRLKK